MKLKMAIAAPVRDVHAFNRKELAVRCSGRVLLLRLGTAEGREEQAEGAALDGATPGHGRRLGLEAVQGHIAVGSDAARLGVAEIPASKLLLVADIVDGLRGRVHGMEALVKSEPRLTKVAETWSKPAAAASTKSVPFMLKTRSDDVEIVQEREMGVFRALK